MRISIVCLLSILIAIPAVEEVLTFPVAPAADDPVLRDGGAVLVADLRQHRQGLLLSRQRLACRPGPLTLWYPRWIPGTHAPSGPLRNLAGPRIFLPDGQLLAWERDPLEPHRITCVVPPGVAWIDLACSYIANQSDENSCGIDIVLNPSLGMLNWNCCLFYPDGAALWQMPWRGALILPEGWGYGSALVADGPAQPVPLGSLVTFQPVPLGELVDRPVLAGMCFVRHALAARNGRSFVLEVVGADPAQARIPDWYLDGLRPLQDEALACFGDAPYGQYHALLMVSDLQLGLEHRRCALNGLSALGQTREETDLWNRSLVPHEYVHAWIGKWRRPAGMAVGDLHHPQDTSLLWVYEGLTEYLGMVLATRSGMAEVDDFHEFLVETLIELENQPGRRWRSLSDTCRASHLLREYSQHHRGLRRGQDYYREGALFWLAADLRLRISSQGQRSLDDFCKAFIGSIDPAAPWRTHTRAEVVEGLKALANDQDWERMIRERIESVAPVLDTTFLADGGWKLEWGPVERSGDGKDPEADRSSQWLLPSLARTLGLHLADWSGTIESVREGSPAAEVGITAGYDLKTINDLPVHELDCWKGLLRAQAGQRLKLLVGEVVFEVVLAAPFQVPRLLRLPDTPDRLGDLLAARRQAQVEADPLP